jgi:hypothetical protein
MGVWDPQWSCILYLGTNTCPLPGCFLKCHSSTCILDWFYTCSFHNFIIYVNNGYSHIRHDRHWNVFTVFILGCTIETMWHNASPVLFVAVVLQADIFSIYDKSLCALFWCALASVVSLVDRLERNWGDKRILGMNLYFSITSVFFATVVRLVVWLVD